jgi:hypothetical protein
VRFSHKHPFAVASESEKKRGAMRLALDPRTSQ